MIIRSAVLEGHVAEADRAAFDQALRTEVLPVASRYPGLVRVVLRQPVEQEEGAPQVYAVFEMHYPTLQAMHEALASPVRQQVRAQMAPLLGRFQGRVYHLVTDEIGSVPGPA